MKDTIALHDEIALLREQLAAKEHLIKAEQVKLAERDKKITERDATITELKEQLKYLLNRRYAPSSEKASPDQLGLFNEAEAIVVESELEESCPAKSHTHQPKPRVSIPAELPREDIIHDLPEAEKRCPHDGSVLKLIGSEDHEQLEIIPAKIKVVRHKRLKYACSQCDQHIVTAHKPKQAIEKSIASPSLLAYIAVQKYADALPLYRQSEMLKRIGITLDRSNLANWMVKCGTLVQPLINLLMDHLQQQAYIHMDETTHRPPRHHGGWL